MNTLQRGWLNWKHRRKFARLGKGCRFPIPDLTVEGHVELGDLCRFRNNATFRTHGEGRIVFSSRSGCSWGVLIEASSLVRIEEYTAIAEYSVVSDTHWVLIGNEEAPSGVERVGRPIHIGPNVFVGSSCYIGPGVTIGEGAVVATHSVVLQDVGPYEIWSGAPARFVSHRTQNIPEAKLREYQELMARQGLRADRYKT
ncbi:MAG: acyltransferase [Candidatus Hydrogenedentes bacterium]|nr:acyltransferase [Candidatus Hydrogenedentota bacterium]MBI3118579.1 acyltransferase [Candidatus Hydrogenedentota bacterium]